MDAASYNYATFDGYVESGADIEEFGAFPNHLHAGDDAPDARLMSLDDGAEMSLAGLWKRQNVVVEFGSFT